MAMPRKINDITLRVSRRELATILAALRFHQNENLQGGGEIVDQSVKEIATDGGLLKPLRFREVGRLCERLNLDEDLCLPNTLVIEPPHKEGLDRPLFRVAYTIDVNASNALDAARHACQIMRDPESQPPVLQVVDHRGKVVSIDLSKKRPALRRRRERRSHAKTSSHDNV
jgi:hypothetical protein